ncbi:uncharacterized protein BJ212DRAFT_1481873 [Suillus subaureus]|uniref:Protein kinase domain-containing protein n=1 Tax=Suillus subaureus TaxID=48587 RepID=A0A9P7JC84_9AGAM|nr:uncharacterized protein BJ212DRAFT_1481873 [Suillus subaureus]KAG1814670.1 hypothetical protein BJ212DRAFT_1481873 [Suillus subaureus]
MSRSQLEVRDLVRPTRCLLTPALPGSVFTPSSRDPGHVPPQIGHVPPSCDSAYSGIEEIEEDSSQDEEGDGTEQDSDEAYYHEYERSFAREVEAYRCLGHLQGSAIPRLYGLGRVISGHGEGRAISPQVLFMEYIPGKNLATIQDPHSVPISAYQELVKAVSSLASFGTIHADMRPENIVVSCSNPRRVVLIDFGVRLFRYTDESNDNWEENVMTEGDERELRRYLERSGIWHQELCA